MTAKELLNSMAADPANQELRARKDAELAAFASQFADEERMIAGEAKALGYAICSVWDFVNNNWHPVLERKFIGPYDLAYPMLIRHLQVPHHPRVREGIIRALTVRDGGGVVWQLFCTSFIVRQTKDCAGYLQMLLKWPCRTASGSSIRKLHMLTRTRVRSNNSFKPTPLRGTA